MNAIVTYQSLWRGAIQITRERPGLQHLPKAVVDAVLTDLCRGTGVRPSDILGSDTNRTHIIPLRQEAMYRLRAMTDPTGRPLYSYPSIGARLGGRDHTTVMHGVRAHHRRLASQREALAA